ncbi:tRNA guanosine-2'-O-methyltransferase [Atractiella rhizophila]|nr:tRNA guanosine-2'-O-methyltransferase [Atractiella rhizophila]
MKKYILWFVADHPHFRLPELYSICSMYSISMTILGSEEEPSIGWLKLNTFLIVLLDDEHAADLLASRSMLLKEVWEYWADGATYDDVHAVLKESKVLWSRFEHQKSFKFSVAALNAGILPERRQEIVESFSYMGFTGDIRMYNPELDVACIEDHYPQEHRPPHLTSTLRRIYMGRKLREGQRKLLSLYSLKTRHYIGNTAMPPEISFLMANQAKACPGKLVYDPFVGTGSMLLSCAHFGSFVMGSDLDGRQLRGKGEGGTRSNFEAYGLTDKLIDFFTGDITQFPLDTGDIFDAIVCDPPYGVRAGAKKLGRKGNRKPLAEEPFMLEDGNYSHRMPDYLPPMQAFEMSEVLTTLLSLSHRLLKPGGRLVYFLPTVETEYKDDDVPTLSGMTLIANSVQEFGHWARRLITMEKLSRSANTKDPTTAGVSKQPAHFDFRRKYFKDTI